jgi:hypothetical protein
MYRSYSVCSFGWWLVVGADLFWEKNNVGWLLVAVLFWEKNIVGWWLISQTNRAVVSQWDLATSKWYASQTLANSIGLSQIAFWRNSESDTVVSLHCTTVCPRRDGSFIQPEPHILQRSTTPLGLVRSRKQEATCSSRCRRTARLYLPRLFLGHQSPLQPG